MGGGSRQSETITVGFTLPLSSSFSSLEMGSVKGHVVEEGKEEEGEGMPLKGGVH